MPNLLSNGSNANANADTPGFHFEANIKFGYLINFRCKHGLRP